MRIATIREAGNTSVFKRLGFEIIGENTDELCEGITGEIGDDGYFQANSARPALRASSAGIGASSY